MNDPLDWEYIDDDGYEDWADWVEHNNNYKDLLEVKMNPEIRCKNGFRMSVQAQEFHYCLPRQNEGPHTHVECGFPSVAPGPEMMEYAENPNEPTETVYAYVPREVVERELESHGGIVFGSLPE